MKTEQNPTPETINQLINDLNKKNAEIERLKIIVNHLTDSLSGKVVTKGIMWIDKSM